MHLLKAAAVLSLLAWGGCNSGCGKGAKCDGADSATTPIDDDACVSGCEATLAADCANGPADQATCVSDCEDLRAGACAVEYEDVLACPGAVACDPDAGIPIVEGCEVQFDAFLACLNQ